MSAGEILGGFYIVSDIDWTTRLCKLGQPMSECTASFRFLFQRAEDCSGTVQKVRITVETGDFSYDIHRIL